MSLSGVNIYGGKKRAILYLNIYYNKGTSSNIYLRFLPTFLLVGFLSPLPATGLAPAFFTNAFFPPLPGFLRPALGFSFRFSSDLLGIKKVLLDLFRWKYLTNTLSPGLNLSHFLHWGENSYMYSCSVILENLIFNVKLCHFFCPITVLFRSQ